MCGKCCGWVGDKSTTFSPGKVLSIFYKKPLTESHGSRFNSESFLNSSSIAEGEVG
jgi:hypothetical protein